jgi:hypothetical protein
MFDVLGLLERAADELVGMQVRSWHLGEAA